MKPPEPRNRRERRMRAAPPLQLRASAPPPPRAPEPPAISFPGRADAQRTCGECRLCCKLLSINEHGRSPATGEPYRFDKPAYQWCTHAGPGGCALHGTVSMPYSCRIFECEWLAGMSAEEDRPDHARIVVVLEADETFGTDGLLAVLWEEVPGQHRTPAGVRILKQINARPEVTAICVISGYRTPAMFLVRAGPNQGTSWGNSLEARGSAKDIDVDQERAFLRELFDGEAPEDLRGIRSRIHQRLTALTPAESAALFARVEQAIRTRGRVPTA